LLEGKRRRKMENKVKEVSGKKVVFDIRDGIVHKRYTAVEDVALLVWFRSKLVKQRDIVLALSKELKEEIKMMEKRIERGDKTEVTG